MSKEQSATGGEENWERMVRLLRDERCVGRADLMADAAKMIERLVGYLDNASAASETRESEPPCRVGDAVTMLMKAAKGLYNGFEPDNQSKLYYEVDAFIRSIHPFECGPLATCSSVSAIVPTEQGLHQLLDRVDIGRRCSFDGGKTWKKYSFVERLHILIGAYKILEAEQQEDDDLEGDRESAR